MLMLAGPLYMLQVYDRVLASHSVPTLIALSIFLVGAYALPGGARSDPLARRGARAPGCSTGTSAPSCMTPWCALALRTRQAGEAHQPVRDLDQIRAFLTSPGPIAIVDLPWMPVFLSICFLHPSLARAAWRLRAASRCSAPPC